MRTEQDDQVMRVLDHMFEYLTIHFFDRVFASLLNEPLEHGFGVQVVRINTWHSLLEIHESRQFVATVRVGHRWILNLDQQNAMTIRVAVNVFQLFQHFFANVTVFRVFFVQYKIQLNSIKYKIPK
jgi:hypothetical protein